MVVRPYGLVSRVAGTEYINDTKGKARFMKFVFSPTDSYIIECGAGYFRFYQNGGQVYKNDVPYEIANNFTEADLDTIQYVQLDDVIKIVYKRDGSRDNKPKELIRKASDDWEFRDVDFESTPYLDENTTATTMKVSAVTGNGITVTASANTFKSSDVGRFLWIGDVTEENNLKKQGYVKITQYTDAKNVKADVKWKISTTSATSIWGIGAWCNELGWPSAIGLLDGRLYYGRTPHQPRNVYGSRPYKYENFMPGADAAGGINLELASNASGDGSDIKWIVGTSFLLVGTYGSEFVIKGGTDAGITAISAPSVRARSNWGSETVQPVVIGSTCYFIQRTGKKIRRFEYDLYMDNYKSVDVSIFSEHLLDCPIKQVAYQKNPDSVLWILREDGKVVTLTVEEDQQVQAYSLIDYGNDVVESIETIPSFNGLYDEVYLIVKRNINGQTVRQVERIQDPITPENVVNCWYVRDGLKFDAFQETAGNTLTLSAKKGAITITTSKDTFQAKHFNRRIRAVDSDYNVIGQAIITEVVNARTVKATVNKEFSATTYSGTTWGLSVANMSGYHHLEGRTIQIFADGCVQNDRVVTGGAFELDLDSWIVLAGLPYTSYITTMNLEDGSQNGTAVGKRKRVNELSMRLWRSSGSRVGRDLNTLEEVNYREPVVPMGTARPLVSGIIDRIRYNQGWTVEADITVEQSRPLPMNILAIAPILNEVDK